MNRGQSATSLSSSVTGMTTGSTNTDAEDLNHSNPLSDPVAMLDCPLELLTFLSCAYVWKFWLQHPYLEVPLSPLLSSQTHCSSLECPLDGCAIAIYGFRNFVLVPVPASIQNILDLFSLLPHNHVWKDPANGGRARREAGNILRSASSLIPFLSHRPTPRWTWGCMPISQEPGSWLEGPKFKVSPDYIKTVF